MDRHAFSEVVLGEQFVGRTLKELGFRARYGAAVLGIHRAGHRVAGKLGDVPLRTGDTLLVLGDESFYRRYRNSGDFLVVAPLSGIPPTQPRKAKRVGIIGLAFIALTGLGILPILQGSLLVALAVIATRALTLQQARKAVDLNIVLLIGAAFGLGAAVESSGLGQVIADLLLAVFGPFGPVGALAGVLHRDNGGHRAHQQ